MVEMQRLFASGDEQQSGFTGKHSLDDATRASTSKKQQRQLNKPGGAIAAPAQHPKDWMPRLPLFMTDCYFPKKRFLRLDSRSHCRDCPCKRRDSALQSAAQQTLTRADSTSYPSHPALMKHSGQLQGIDVALSYIRHLQNTNSKSLFHVE
jgi:hypothetical protein